MLKWELHWRSIMTLSDHVQYTCFHAWMLSAFCGGILWVASCWAENVSTRSGLFFYYICRYFIILVLKPHLNCLLCKFLCILHVYNKQRRFLDASSVRFALRRLRRSVSVSQRSTDRQSFESWWRLLWQDDHSTGPGFSFWLFSFCRFCWECRRKHDLWMPR